MHAAGGYNGGYSYPTKPAGRQSESVVFSDRTATVFGTWASERRELWPGVFTLILFAFFGPAVVSGLRIATDPTARYWLGWHSWFILVVPALLVVCHGLHMVAERPRFWPTLFSSVVPSAIVILVGYVTLVPIGIYSKELVSTDCTTYASKFELENAYRSAATIFDTCVERVAAYTNSSLDATFFLIDLPDCAEYQAALGTSEYTRQWAYLQQLEANQACSGWCTPGEPGLWTRTHSTLDLCASAAGAQMRGKIQRLGQRMTVLGVVQLFFSMWGMNCIHVVMKTMDVPW